MFTENCFIRKNTQELREKLDELGYIHTQNWPEKSKNKCRMIMCDNNYVSRYYYNYIESQDKDFFKTFIDCGDNEDLFLAIAALRDDSYKYQYITNGKIFMTCEKDDINEFVNIIYDGYHFKNDKERERTLSDRWHKATVEELIEHFK